MLVEPSVQNFGVSEYRSKCRERQRQRQRQIGATGVVRTKIQSKGVYFDYKLKFCLEARTVYILQGSELTEQILVRI